MRNDYHKYGGDVFKIELVENVYDINLVQEIENYWIDEVRKKYGDKLYNRDKSTFSSFSKRNKTIKDRYGKENKNPVWIGLDD